MPDILHDLPIRTTPERLFDAVSLPAGLDRWWTARSVGAPAPGAEYELWFGPEYDWRARVTVCEPPRRFELALTRAMPDWMGTVVGFELVPTPGGTELHFSHRGWAEPTAHYRTSCCCWAMYLRILRRALEYGEDVEYEKRLEV